MERDVLLGDVQLRVEVTGPRDGPLALCLHGFPDSPFTFRHLAPRLVERGYRVATPWLRGYAPSSTSRSNNYRLSALAGDANELHQRLGADERALIVGHDWGAAIAYGACALEPSYWSKCVAMAVPPVQVFAPALFRFDQARRSWYMWFFHNPLVDGVVAADEFNFFTELWRSWSPRYDPSDDLVHVRRALATSESLGAALAYYRSMFLPADDGGVLSAALAKRATVPTLYVHGDEDGCVGVEVVDGVEEHLAANSRVTVLAHVGHFAHLEAPDVLWREVDAFLA
ncbi:MAG: hypothetical protein B7X07_06555 [Actinobacteria bacterium 21-64-8]|nr:MAG: hypothetical protein B7X07_06555 [Actinobacteria bacterium 21-64-8]